MRSVVAVSILAATAACGFAAAQTPSPPSLDARASDPVRMGWMVGAPPPPGEAHSLC